MPVDGYPQLGIQPEPAASAVKKERPAYPGIKETLLKGVVSPSEQGGAYPACTIQCVSASLLLNNQSNILSEINFLKNCVLFFVIIYAQMLHYKKQLENEIY
jgi:hypothetical protein